MRRMGYGRIKARVQNYWAGLSESERSMRQVALGAAVLAVLAVPAWFFGWPAWQRWQRGQAIEQVRVFAEQNDYRNATLALRRALELGAGDPAAWEQAVRLLGEIGSPEVLTAHEQLARLNPGDTAVKLALVRDALRFERYDVARDALDTVDANGRNEASFYRLAAALAQAMGRDEEIEATLARLVEAAPDDAVARFNLAAVRLWSLDEAKRAAARTELAALAADRRVRVRAALEWLKDAAREQDEKRLRETVAALQEKFVPGWRADFPDANGAGWARLVEHLKGAAGSDGAGAAAVLGGWLGEIGQPREALVWLESLPAPVRGSEDVADVAAELSAKIGDLDRVERYLREGAWGVWPRDALTLAIASRLQVLRYGEAPGRTTWGTALAAAGGSLPGLRAMVRLADAWGDGEGRERALQEVVTRFPKSFWAHEALADYHAGRRDLPRLAAVYEQWIRQMPSDAELTVRVTVLASILDRLTAEGLKRIETLHARGPSSGSTIALAAARWRRGKPSETVALLATLPEEEQALPAATLWRGLAQADLGDKAAENALQTAWRSGLSAEEGVLVRAAAAKAKIRLGGTP